MKTTLFLVLVGGSFVICSCQQQTPPPTPEETPVAPSVEVAAPIVVTPVKSAANVSGGIAPESIVGTDIQLWCREGWSSEAQEVYTFNTANIGVEANSNAQVTYTKTGPKTATLSGGGKVYNLTFTSKTKGTVSGAKNKYDISRFIIEQY